MIINVLNAQLSYSMFHQCLFRWQEDEERQRIEGREEVGSKGGMGLG